MFKNTRSTVFFEAKTHIITNNKLKKWDNDSAAVDFTGSCGNRLVNLIWLESVALLDHVSHTAASVNWGLKFNQSVIELVLYANLSGDILRFFFTCP